jgi:hypothetical protein
VLLFPCLASISLGVHDVVGCRRPAFQVGAFDCLGKPGDPGGILKSFHQLG